jgi:hypothetical protein
MHTDTRIRILFKPLYFNNVKRSPMYLSGKLREYNVGAVNEPP